MRFRPEIALTRFQLVELQFEHFPEERDEALERLKQIADRVTPRSGLPVHAEIYDLAIGERGK